MKKYEIEYRLHYSQFSYDMITRVFEGKKWTLFTPNETPDLHDLTGSAFKTRYEEYEKAAQEGKIKVFKEIEAEELWR